ncbi:Rcs stress response system protein RcsF [Erwinia psidii]|uniref:Outer membrane lipoprotein RcsF n=1 Tax=Erwinia psidii TaxID=69224 RepID=A0A3N6RYV5_9GAMM|nr:Rcs stress response system protein RcsF [Erwinia psidii]MCX8957737.1 Rcs stress response system protein RcsF [Erwinia psidii]MCX8960786.1 Rcs stress response system protein RcsF [Erwinia psidii]MCX8964974.1 Rcs stress response system protein RcsF [Erwinia psidii]RQM38354.1 Rcs stress response system protein RcsF [Erwinia psidii]
MRVLPLCLLALSLTGCSLLQKPYKPVKPFSQPTQTVSEQAKTVSHPAPVKLYTNASDLMNGPFRDLGEVYGEDCQNNRQSSPPNINTARKRLQIHAANMKANAVLLHRCEIVSDTQGCFRKAVCEGSALKVTRQ